MLLSIYGLLFFPFGLLCENPLPMIFASNSAANQEYPSLSSSISYLLLQQ
jgi:hypothetical protein